MEGVQRDGFKDEVLIVWASWQPKFDLQNLLKDRGRELTHKAVLWSLTPIQYTPTYTHTKQIKVGVGVTIMKVHYMHVWNSQNINKIH